MYIAQLVTRQNCSNSYLHFVFVLQSSDKFIATNQEKMRAQRKTDLKILSILE